MDLYGNFLTRNNDVNKKIIDVLSEYNNEVFEESMSWLTKIEADVKKFKADGKFPTRADQVPKSKKGQNSKKNSQSSNRSSLKENQHPNGSVPATAGRSRRNAFKEATQVINSQTTHFRNVIPVVKCERLSEASDNQSKEKSTAETIKVKKEMDVNVENNMPPPADVPAKRVRKKKFAESDGTTATIKEESEHETKRSTRGRNRTTMKQQQSRRQDSDVVMHKESVVTINLLDTEEEATLASEDLQEVASKKENKASFDKDSSETEEKPKNERSGRNRTKATGKGKRLSDKETSGRCDGIENAYTVKEQEAGNCTATDHLEGKTDSIRTTRTKTKAAKQMEEAKENCKRLRSPSPDFPTQKQPPKPKRTKRKKEEKIEESPKEVENSVYEDAMSVVANDKLILNETDKAKVLNETVTLNNNINPNETVVLNRHTDRTETVANETVVVSTPKVLQQSSNKNGVNVPCSELNDLMTDDESLEQTPTPAKPKILKKPKGAKQIFSPFANSPVKKRVEAFEKLGAEVPVDEPTRTTRTKTRAMAKEDTHENVSPKPQNSLIPKAIREKAKQETPLTANRIIPSAFFSAGKLNRTVSRALTASNESLISIKSASALKASQAEFKERELKRREKEAEAIRKRDAMLQLQIEEKRRKREEKQLKAQQQREAREKDKQKMLEDAERAKDEKLKQALAEKEEKFQKQREEAQRKRALVMKKAAEEKRKEEERRKVMEEEKRKVLKEQKKEAAVEENRRDDMVKLEKQKVQRDAGINEKKLPIYMTTPLPLLPTYDCYDSDDPDSCSKVSAVPSWARKENLSMILMAMQYTGDKIKNTFFCCQAQTPDLRKMFHSIDPRKLKRTSSANWRVPPRFTLMPLTNMSLSETDEED